MNNNNINFDLTYIRDLYESNGFKWSKGKTVNYTQMKNNLINLGVIKGIIKKMDFISVEDEKTIVDLYKKGFNASQIAEWIQMDTKKRTNYPGVVRILKKYNLKK